MVRDPDGYGDTPSRRTGSGVSLPSGGRSEDDACHGAPRVDAEEALPERRACRGTVAVRDRVVLWVLMVGAVLGLLAWCRLGPWIALVTVLAALLVASVAYRVEPPRIDLDRPLPPLEREEGVSAPSSRADQ
jgi:hypothetical protein